MSPSELPRPFAFQTTPAPWPVHPPRRREENSNLTRQGAHSLAARPGALADSLSMRAPGGIRTLTSEGHTGLGRARLPELRHQRMRASPAEGAIGICLGGLLSIIWSFRARRSPLTHPRHFQLVSTR